MQSPTAEPRIPASASGVSTQRSAPKRSRSPAVARKTPPARPTSSPITSTDGSRSSSTWKASLIASTMLSSGTEDPPELLELGRERGRRIGVGVVEEQPDIRLRLGFRGPDALAHQLGRLGADRLGKLVREHGRAAEVALEATKAFARTLLLDPLGIDVGARVVGGRVRRGAVGDGLDEGRPLTRARPLDSLARR